jgi:hypothetical protein
MFTWVCQRCGTEVDIARTECPRCHAPEGSDVELGSARGAAREPVPSVQRPAPLPPPQRLDPETTAPSGPAEPERQPDVFSLKSSHLLVFLFALLAATATAVYLSQPQLFIEWRDNLLTSFAGSEDQPIPLPEPGMLEAAGLRAWRDENAVVRIRATLVNHQISPVAAGDYEVLVLARVGDEAGRLLGAFPVTLDAELPGRTSVEVESPFDAPDGLARFPHWSDLVGRVRRPQSEAVESQE